VSYKGKKYDWSNLEELASKHIPTEIAKIKGCTVETVRLALWHTGIKAQLSEFEKRMAEKREAGQIKVEARESKKLKCASCSNPLTIIPWNAMTEMAFCDHYGCKLWHTPISHKSLILPPKEEDYASH